LKKKNTKFKVAIGIGLGDTNSKVLRNIVTKTITDIIRERLVYPNEWSYHPNDDPMQKVKKHFIP